MNNIFKRILSLILVLVMCISMLPISTFADDVEAESKTVEAAETTETDETTDVAQQPGNETIEMADSENDADTSPKDSVSSDLYISAVDSDQNNDVLTYIEENGEITITDCDENASGTLNVPEEFNGCPVTKIGNNAFQNCAKIFEVILPETITEIGEYAFNSSGLKYISTQIR